jgi:hypothetical protein
VVFRYITWIHQNLTTNAILTQYRQYYFPQQGEAAFVLLLAHLLPPFELVTG